ncbi:MAG: NAD(P)H-dependent oxidoreductase [Candidatus Omnitrophota bacterium]
MIKALVGYYSRTGNTEKMAQIISQSLKKTGIEVDLKEITQISADMLVDYEILILGSPTYYGSMAYQVKKLLDESVKHHRKLEGKIGGAFSSAANIAGGNETTILDIINAFLIHGMIVQGDSNGDHYGPVSIGAPDARAKAECEKFGKRIGLLAKKIF